MRLFAKRYEQKRASASFMWADSFRAFLLLSANFESRNKIELRVVEVLPEKFSLRGDLKLFAGYYLHHTTHIIVIFSS